MEDESIATETAGTIAKYRDLLGKLEQTSRPLDDSDRKTLGLACLHARIWRESYLDSWINTGEKQVILEARQDIKRIARTETALGGRYITALEHALANAKPVSIFELQNRDKFGK